MLNRRYFPIVGCLLVVAVSTAMMAPKAVAQSYEADQYDKRLSPRGRIAIRYAKQPSGGPEDRKDFESYIENYYFPAMTQPSPEGLEALGKLRYDLFKQLIWPAAPEIKQWLSDKALKFSVKIVRSRRYHPAVTYNALLILGQIDERYATDSQPQAKPEPNANKLLNNLVATAAKDARVPRYWLAASLVGLERHTRYFDNLPESGQALTERTLGALLTVKELPGQYEEGVRDWIYLRAAQALANTGQPGQGGRRFLAIAKRVADDSLEIETRTKIASQLANLKAQAGAFDGSAAAKVVLDLSAQIAKQEKKSAEDFENSQLRRGGGIVSGQSRSKSGRRYNQVDRNEIVLVREGLLDLLKDLSQAVSAVRPLAKDQQAQSLESIATAIDRTVRQISDKDEIDLNIAAGIKSMANAILSATAEPSEKLAAEDEDLL